MANITVFLLILLAALVLIGIIFLAILLAEKFVKSETKRFFTKKDRVLSDKLDIQINSVLRKNGGVWLKGKIFNYDSTYLVLAPEAVQAKAKEKETGNKVLLLCEIYTKSGNYLTVVNPGIPEVIEIATPEKFDGSIETIYLVLLDRVNGGRAYFTWDLEEKKLGDLTVVSVVSEEEDNR